VGIGGTTSNKLVGGPMYTSTGSVSSLGYGIGYKDDTANKLVTAKVTVYGDTNLDNSVTLADLTTTLGNFGKTNQYWANGDFNYDSSVTLADLTTVLGNFGKSRAAGFDATGGGSGPVGSGSGIGLVGVPEPGTLALLVAGLVGLLAYAWRKRK